MLRLLGPAVLHPNVWSLNRRSVAGGVAAGLFCGLVPGPFQIISASLVAILMKWNLPIAAFVTLYTNPVTFVPLYLVGLKIGVVAFSWLGMAEIDGQSIASGAIPSPPDFHWTEPWTSLLALAQWGLELGWPLAVGVCLLGLGLALTGYALVWGGWSATVWRSRQRRLAERRSRTRSQRSAS